MRLNRAILVAVLLSGCSQTEATTEAVEPNSQLELAFKVKELEGRVKKLESRPVITSVPSEKPATNNPISEALTHSKQKAKGAEKDYDNTVLKQRVEALEQGH